MNLNDTPSSGPLYAHDFEPWHLPHMSQALDNPPAPAEACTEIGVDDQAPATFSNLIWVGAGCLIGLACFSALCGYIVARI